VKEASRQTDRVSDDLRLTSADSLDLEDKDAGGPVQTSVVEIEAVHAGPAAEDAEKQPSLGITEIRLCRKIRGFGSFEPIEDPSLQAGRQVLLYCEPTGVEYEPVEDAFRSRVSGRVDLIAPDDGTPKSANNAAKGKSRESVVWTTELADAEDRCRRPRHDYFVGCRLTIPSTIAAGSYRLRLTLTDRVADCEVSTTIPVTIDR
jgi:hypothetical protein